MPAATAPIPDPADGPGGDGTTPPQTRTSTDDVFEVQHLAKRFGAVVALFLAVADGSLLGTGAPSALAVVALVVAGLLGVAGVVLGLVAVRRAEVHGGGGAARASIVLSVAAIALGLFALLR